MGALGFARYTSGLGKRKTRRAAWAKPKRDWAELPGALHRQRAPVREGHYEVRPASHYRALA